MHPSSGCTALASARAHRVCILYATQAGFILVNLFSFVHPSLSLSLFLSAFLSLFFPQSSFFYLYHTVSFRYILCSDFSSFSATCTPRVSPYSLLTFPTTLIGTPLLLYTLTSILKTLLVSSLFALLHLQWQSLLYVNNPHHGILCDLYT